MSQQQTTLIVPMPIPGTPTAPCFDGTSVDDFLEIIQQHGKLAGIKDNDDLAPYILRYSTPSVKKVIRYVPEFDPDTQNKTWAAAKRELTTIYGGTDKTDVLNEEDLKDYCRSFYAKPAFANRKAVDAYHRGFLSIAAPLVKDAVLTTKQRDYFFTTGIPSAMKDWFIQQVPEAKRKRSNPPSVTESLSYLYRRFDTDSLSFDPWEERQRQQLRFDEHVDQLEDQSTSTASQFTTSKTLYPNTPPHKPSPSPSATQMEELSRRLAEMAINLIQQQSVGPTISQQQPRNRGGGDGPRSGRCFLCGKAGDELDHILHPSRCTLTPGLLSDGLMIFSASRNRYILPNGDDLPLVPGYPGGVAAYLRTIAKARADNKDAKRDSSHTENSSSNPSQSAHTNSIGFVYGDQDVIQENVFAVTALPSSSYSSNPSLRSGKDVSSRFDPIQRPDDKAKPKTKPTRPPQTLDTPPVPQVSKPPTTSIFPLPTNPINTQEGWKGSLPSNRSKPDKSDVQMSDDTKKLSPSGPQYHFTSDIQERAKPTEILEDIMQTKVSLPIYQIIGSSPQLQKLVGEATRTRRSYSTKSAEYEDDLNTDHDAGQCEVAHDLYASNFDRFPEFLVHYSNAITVSPQRKFFAMTTGALRVQMHEVDLLAMVDSGSELNLASNSVPDRTSAAIDFEGMKWSLRGINGGPEQLQGVITDGPLKMAGHDFPHHFFVSHNSLGKHDLILGQPFLQWYAARIDYDRNCVVKMFLWKEGDRSVKPTICISITDPADPRNATSIGHSHGAIIEEVPDEEVFHH